MFRLLFIEITPRFTRVIYYLMIMRHKSADIFLVHLERPEVLLPQLLSSRLFGVEVVKAGFPPQNLSFSGYLDSFCE